MKSESAKHLFAVISSFFVVLFLVSPKIAYITLQGFWIGGAAAAFVLICEEIKHG